MKQNLILLGLLIASSLSSQQIKLTAECNTYRAGDIIIKQQVEYKDPGSNGKNITWDFSMLNPVDEKYKIRYLLRTRADSAQVTANEHDTRYRYQLKNDTLWLHEYINRTTKMCFTKPEAQLKFPFYYGDSIKSVFEGAGNYCDKVDLIAKGNTYATVDATGEMITPSKQILKNVVRVHRVRNYTEIGVDSATLRLETYSWYAQNYRYPVFETYESFIVKTDTTIEDFKTSFYYPIEEMTNLATDLANEKIEEESVKDINLIYTEATYMPNPVVSQFQINYKLTRTAIVWFSLHNSIGIPIQQTKSQKSPMGHNTTTINMSQLTTGTYTLYVHVDDKVIKQIIIKK